MPDLIRHYASEDQSDLPTPLVVDSIYDNQKLVGQRRAVAAVTEARPVLPLRDSEQVGARSLTHCLKLTCLRLLPASLRCPLAVRCTRTAPRR